MSASATQILESGTGHEALLNRIGALPRLLYCASQMWWFLQIEGKSFHQQKHYNSLYCNTCFTGVIWNWTHNISEECLYRLMDGISEDLRRMPLGLNLYHSQSQNSTWIPPLLWQNILNLVKWEILLEMEIYEAFPLSWTFMVKSHFQQLDFYGFHEEKYRSYRPLLVNVWFLGHQHWTPWMPVRNAESQALSQIY